ncbi:sensor histidine kinase [Paenibacillus sp. SYP-B4298]|uniref:sensor histidine kinase n=1 Tax=Paenibacillus sp. SYP-B4298 TaxID=2996034 RepID=UPI0022DD3DDE|nr:histidine kinase [Paenibacillus sp. SYP-B4298]
MRLLNNVKLRNKMLAVYFLCVFAPILLTNLIFYNVIADNVRDQRIQDIDRAIAQIGNEFSQLLDDAVGLSSYFYTDFRINEILERDFVYAEDYVEAYDGYLRRVMNSYNPGAVSYQNMLIYVDNTTLLHSGNIGYLSEQIRATDWYRAAGVSAGLQPVFVRTEGGGGRFATFSLLRKLDYFPERMHKEKLLKIDFRTIDLEELFTNLNIQGDMYLINPSGYIEYTTNRELDWRASSKQRYAQPESPSTIEFALDYSDISYLQGWRIIGTVNSDEVSKEVWKTRDFILWSACLMVTLPTLIITITTRSITRRIVKILRHMKKVKSQNFEIIQEADARDEIGQLTLEFNRMTQQIKSLIQDVYLADIQKKSSELERRKAQLNALQSQVNPHFLFNALETIRMRSLLKNEEETANIIHSMAKILRSSLTWSKDRITVQEELQFIRCFLDIQKYRFEDKLDYHIQVDPDAYLCTIPKMMFLPFVENACIHGIEALKHGGVLEIQIEVIGQELVFAIRDNGVGMTMEKAEELRRYVQTDEVMGERIGIQNVIYRSKLIYGDQFRFELHSAPGDGTHVRLSIPKGDGSRRESISSHGEII